MTDYAQPSDVPLSFYQNIPEECVDAEHHPTKNREPQRIRPEPIPVNPDKESFHFFLIDTVYRVLPPPYGIEISLYGESFRGNSVAVRVYNFNPHFAIQAPEPGRWTMNHYAIFQESLEEALREKVSKHKEASFFKELILSITPFKGFDLYDYNGTEPISFLRIEVAYPKLVRECRFLLEYPLGRPASKFLPEIKAWWPENDLPPPVANPYEHKKTNRGFPEYFKIYEANVDFGFRFQVDHKIKATGWVKLDATMYQNVQRAHKRNDSQYEFTCDHHAVGWSHISSKILPPLCIYSFDGEMETAGRAFPQAVYYEDPKTKKKPIPGSGQRILQFGFRKSLDKTDVKGVHLVGSCDPVKNANEIYSYYNESDFCKGFRQEWGVTDPTFVLDYNGANFDFPYMIGRFKQLGLYQRYGDFGRRKGENTKAIHTTFNTSAHKTEKYAITLEGRVHIDVLQCLQREKKLRSYTLNAVAERFLGKRKVEMDYHLINTHQKTPKGRSDLAYYCMIDASLPHDLATELKMIINYIQMAHIAGVSVQHLLDRGQQLRMLAQVYHYSKHTIDNPMPGFDLAPLQYPYVVPVIPTYREFPKDKYEGAEVLEAKKGYHDEPVSTMDFSSLYPSIMIAHNLCWTTLVKKDAINRLKLIENVHYQQIPDFVIQPDGSVKAVPNPQHPCFLLTPVTCFKRMIKFFSFVEGLHYTRENKEKGTKNGWIVCEETEKEFEKIGLIEGFNYKKINSGYDFIHVKEGVSPTLLKNLLATRKQVRKEGEKATGLLAAIIDALQNAFKAMANSWYGGTGTGERGYLPLREIAETVTRYGRCYIMMTKWFIETNFNSSKGFPFDTEGIYGDTDSVFVKFKLCKEPLLKPEGQEWVCENTTGKGMSKITSRYDLEYIQKVSLQMADQVTKYIDLDPMSLAYEKSFNGILLVSKKRYAGFKIVWDGGKVKWGDTKFSATGLECVRRDACSIVGEMVETVLKKVILERNVRGAVTYVRGEIEKLYQGKMPYSKLIITKSLSRKPEDYKTKSAHVVLAQRIAERTPEKAYKLGDRVKYVMIPGTHNQKAYELGEDPIYAFENGIGLDYKWYMENQIKRPLQRIFFYVFKNRQVLRELAETEPDAMWVQQSFGNVKEEDLIDSDEEAEDREEQEAMKREYEETEDDYMYEDLDQSEEEGSSPGIKREREESEEESQEEPEPKKQKIENKDRGTLAGFFGIKKSNNEPMKAKRLTLKEKKKQQEKLVKEQQKEIDKGIANSIIFDGPHTRKIVKSAGAEGKGLFQFIKKTTKCFVCKVPTGSTKKPLCGSCLKDGKKDATLEACRKRCDEAQKDFDKSMKICIDCVKQNPSFKIDACRNVDCNNLWDRLTAERCLKTEKDNLSLDW